MSDLASELQRYDFLLGEAREAIARLTALETEGARIDEVTRAELIDTLESGLRQITSVAPAQADRVRQLATLVKEAQLHFGELGLPDVAAGAAEPLPVVRIDSQA